MNVLKTYGNVEISGKEKSAVQKETCVRRKDQSIFWNLKTIDFLSCICEEILILNGFNVS